MTTTKEIGPVAERRVRLIINSYYDVLDQRIRTDHRVRVYAEHAGLVAAMGESEAEALKLQGMETYRKAIADKKDEEVFKVAFKAAEVELDDWHKEMDKTMAAQEAYLKKLAQREIDGVPIWDQWLSKVRGIGPCLAGGLIAWVDPRKAAHVSSLWRYCGLGVTSQGTVCLACGKRDENEPTSNACSCGGTLFRVGEADRRKAGQKLGYNPKCKTLAWKISSQFVRGGGVYRELYDRLRSEVDAKPCRKVHLDPKTKAVVPCFDAHKHAKAMRMTAKIFLSHYWQRGRELLGLPAPKPFAFGVLGHDAASFIEPMVDR